MRCSQTETGTSHNEGSVSCSVYNMPVGLAAFTGLYQLYLLVFQCFLKKKKKGKKKVKSQFSHKVVCMVGIDSVGSTMLCMLCRFHPHRFYVRFSFPKTLA